LEYLLAIFIKLLLRLRYRITVKGLDALNAETLKAKGGVLFLPNHPAYFVDPLIATLSVWPKFQIRPMVVEYMYYTPLVHSVMRFMNAIPIPDFVTSSNSLKRKKNEKVTQTVINGLKQGENYLIYPAGKVKYTGNESIGGASAVQRILQETPEANVVLVRLKGLWGSRFSRAVLNGAPKLSQVTGELLKTVLKNLLFFTPRRHITVELLPAPADFPREGSRLEINRYLEQWYNQPDGLTEQEGSAPGDSLMLVSYSLWKKEFLPLRELAVQPDQEVDLEQIPKEVQDKIIHKLAELKECSPAEIKPHMDLARDLGLDSLDLAEMAAFLHEKFEIEEVSGNEFTSVAKVMGIASKQISTQKESKETVPEPSKWQNKRPHARVFIASGQTIPEIFLNQCKMQGSTIACADLRVGVQTFASLKLRTILLAEYLRKLPGDYIGIMLPASVAANLLILAAQLAGKIPLMVNWTVGPRHLESVIQLSKVQTVITSWAFIDRLENVDLNGVDDRLLMLEDMIRTFTLRDKLKAFIRSKKSTRSLLRLFGVDKKTGADQAVLLFTSGTESMPKGVPLSYENILSNQRAALEAVSVYADDVLYGLLPPFHSFGFTVSGILGLLAGVRVFYYPNPTEGKKLAVEFERWGVTIMIGAPTFIKGMLKSGTTEQFKKMRLCVTGAEKAPPELFQMLENVGKPDILLEGYGITECAPVLTMNPPGAAHKGVGKALPGIQLCIVHPETEQLLPTGERGLILAKGPNVFKEYLNPGLSSPFLILNGESWYKTGDLGFLDAEGNLTISGRMKRFVKMGGEMISLASVEEALLQSAVKKGWPLEQEGPSLALCAKERPGEKTKLFLFTRFPLAVDDANQALKESGFSNLVRISSVVELPEIPIMGTGKIHYRQLQSTYLDDKPN
jgi:long-chain-fatty-acid--[acyl-carrier-protein] ligase